MQRESNEVKKRHKETARTMLCESHLRLLISILYRSACLLGCLGWVTSVGLQGACVSFYLQCATTFVLSDLNESVSSPRGGRGACGCLAILAYVFSCIWSLSLLRLHLSLSIYSPLLDTHTRTHAERAINAVNQKTKTSQKKHTCRSSPPPSPPCCYYTSRNKRATPPVDSP